MQRREFIGESFGRLIVISEVEPSLRKNGKPRRRFLCKCICGNEIVVFGENLTKGNTKSCGCLQKEIASENAAKHRETNSRLYNVWSAIKRRCYNTTVPEYKWYGGRGIQMCDEWRENFSMFQTWAMSAGYDPCAKRGECTIDRIDSNGNYSPENCRWVSQVEQMNNIRTNHNIEWNGQIHTAAEWSRITGISASKILQRINRYGWNSEKALTTN